MSYSILPEGQTGYFQKRIKPAVFSAIILFVISACGQRSISPENKSEEAVVSKDAREIIGNLTLETCECATLGMKGENMAALIDSCFDIMLARHEVSLKQAGLNSQTDNGRYKTRDHLVAQLRKSCPELIKMAEKEFEEQGKKLTFTGWLVSEKKLPSGFFEITLKDDATGETRKFFAKNPINEKEIKRFEPGYSITVEYEIVKNAANKDEFHVKESAGVMTVGSVKVGN